MRVLIDTNVAITFLTKRDDPYTKEADQILMMCASGELDGAIALHSLSTIWYMARKLNPVAVRSWIRQLVTILTVAGTNNQALLSAVDRDEFTDFEDAMQDCCAAEFEADYIITANIRDFRNSRIPAISPKDFVDLGHDQNHQAE